MGDSRRALKVLRKARPQIEEQGDPRQLFALRFNIAVNLVHLGDLDQAERLLPEIRKMAIAQRFDLDLWRVSWLDGRVAGGRGRLGEAVATLRQVRREFTAREIAYDAALAGLDESVFLLEACEFAQAKRVAEETLWVFRSRQVQEEALKALRVLHEAIQGEQATAELAREIRDRFRRAR
jgi:tetratricopeptide (TPR) repeat protein